MKTINLLTLFVLFTFFGKAQQNTQTFTFQGNTFQYFSVPTTGYYLLTARGGQGGPCKWNSQYPTAVGGRGAHMQGYFLLKAGEVIIISVAGAGSEGNPLEGHYANGYLLGGGGGGASSIVRIRGNESIPLLVAGGGGGAGYQDLEPGPRNGFDAQIYQDGVPGYSMDYYPVSDPGKNGGGGNIDYSQFGGAGGAGFYGDGGTHCVGNCDGTNLMSYGGQAYVAGNFGGNSGNSGGNGGWGGGGEGGASGARNPGFFDVNDRGDGGGGGGGGYSGGGGGSIGGAGGGGGSYSTALCGRSDSSGVNYGNGLVTISGPNIATEVVNTPFNPYTWAANGVSYSSAGTYVYTDSANCVTRVLDLSFGLQSCNTYTRVDTTVTFCGGYTWPRNGRTYTQNMIDSIRIGCTKYIVRLVVSPPAAAGAIQGASNACRNTSMVYSVAPVPFATRYQWTLPRGATGSSTTNSITVHFNSHFNGGQIKVAAANNCGASAVQVKLVEKTVKAPSGQLRIASPAGRISGVYSVTPIKGATTYTWKLSNSQARIVSGQGTAQIQLEAGPGFVGTELSVRASNCEGKGTKAEIVLGTVKEKDDDDDDDKKDDDDNDDEKDTKKFVNIKGAEAIDLATSKGIVTGATPISISAYPNPTSGKLTVQLPASAQQGKLDVYNKDGQLVQTLKVPAMSQSIPIDLSAKAKGLYLIRYYAGQEIKSFKVVVK